MTDLVMLALLALVIGAAPVLAWLLVALIERVRR